MKTNLANALRHGAAPLVMSIAMLAGPAYAQQASIVDGPPPAPAAPVDTSATIVVTGTRIVNPNLKSAAPITTVSALDLKVAGTTRTEDILNQLPQVFAAQSSTLANGASGTAEVDLRGLGPKRTLVLINGRRLMAGDPSPTSSSAADLNFIPSSLIKRVDVLTGGASATYGADAVAGVVNFVMDKDLNGLRIDVNDGLYQHNNGSTMVQGLLNARTAAGLSGYDYPKGNTWGGNSIDATISYGTKFADGAGHIMAYFGYRQSNALLQSSRDFSKCTIQNRTVSSNATPRSGLQCGGSATSANGNAVYYTPASIASSSSTIGTLGNGTFGGAPTRYNFAPLNYFQRPDQRYTAGLFADYEVNSALHPYLEFMFMDDHTVAQIAPSGDFGNTLTINCDNPLMSAQQRGEICTDVNKVNHYLGTFPLVDFVYNNLPTATQAQTTAVAGGNTAFFQLLRRNVEGGARVSDLQHTSFRTVVGSKGDLGHGWGYDAYFQYGRTNYNQIYSNEFSAQRLGYALDVVTGPAGTPVCRISLTYPSSGCVPYNIWSGSPSAASLAYLSATGFQNGYTSQTVISGTLTGDLGTYGLKSPLASDGVNIALGVERRTEKLVLNTDNAFQSGDLTGQGAPTLPINGGYHVTEFLGEVAVPVIDRMLTFNGGFRYSDYAINNGKGYKTGTYKLELDFTPIEDIRIRASLNRAVRAPNIQEMFRANYVGLDGVTDPCAGHAIQASETGCLAQGLRVGQVVAANPAAQYNGYLGGNANLRPEKATTKTVGVVFTPHMVPGLSVSVDYFDIKINQAIQSYGADAILTACGSGSSLACSLVHRNAAGSLWLSSDGYVTDLDSNVGWVKTAGFEVNASYSKNVGAWGKISASLTGTALSEKSTYNGLSPAYDCAGYYGPTCGVPAPNWRHKARLTWSTPKNIDVSLTWRYVGSVNVEYMNPSATLADSHYSLYNNKLPAMNYIDLFLTGKVTKSLSVRAGVNNLFDKDPPLVTSGGSGILGAASTPSACASVYCNGNTYPGVYDSLGRYLFVGATVNF
ncbi:outer membrane receptor protein involved in Fe transport [Novosphingobium sp. SG751A]|uniref:TonB-dependent receptor plug domain-containing protein n=1 Tax=Novosphingobium sp. SG751A TaxID=2587000 RepID=UPI001557FE74|nr:TonB-dependent receptor [Novosphingobium sp. SG751A]NOW45525.1 outer membrane receptor protein involved in Fe transport [Novosphingobium sp. SG751A]